MTKGIVKWFNTTKGYGFIEPAEGGSDVFVHISALHEAGLSFLNDNQKVDFEITTDKQGRKSATNLKLQEEVS